MDRDAVRAFMERFMEMATGASLLGVMAVADRTGLFARLAGQGPLRFDEACARSGLQPRYLKEILSALAAGGILVYDDKAETFELPDEHAACLADDRSPYCLAGWTQSLPAMMRAIPGVARAAREGGGVSYTEFGEDMVAGIDRMNSPGMRILLVRKWLPAMDGVVARLQQGIRVADVGCGSGTAAVAIAKSFPQSQVTGFDVDETSIGRARALSAQEETPNVRFEQVGGESLPTEPPFDLITTFDVIHDMVRPRSVLKRIREALRPDGSYLMVEPAAGDTLAENLGPNGALLYSMSTLHCMTVSLAHGGEGLGTAWGPRRAEALCREAGFGRFRRLEIENPFNAFYEVRP